MAAVIEKRKILVGVVIFLGLIFFCLLFITNFIFGSRVQIADVNVGDDYSIQMWKEYLGLRDWDPDNSRPTLYYQVKKSGDVIVPKTWLNLDFDYAYDIRVMYLDDKNLVFVYDAGAWKNGVLVIFDKQTEETGYNIGKTEEWMRIFKSVIE